MRKSKKDYCADCHSELKREVKGLTEEVSCPKCGWKYISYDYSKLAQTTGGND